MTEELGGVRVAFLTADEGVEQVELTSPWSAVEGAGGTPIHVAPERGDVQAFHCEAGSNVLVSSRGPDDLLEFERNLVSVLRDLVTT